MSGSSTAHRVRRTQAQMADGRELFYFDDTEPYVSGGASRVVPDTRDLPTVQHGSIMRFDVLTGEWVTIDSVTYVIERGSREASQIASWRDNLIVAEKEAISALVARIGRWITGRIVMAHPFIGSQRVSGIFDLNNPKQALEAVVHPTGAHVRQVSSFLTIISPL